MRESLDRLAPALVSGDLTSVIGHRCDADFIGALGYASRTYPIASPLLRMYLAHDVGAVREASEKAVDMAKHAARRQGLTLSMRDLVDIGRQALEYAIDKTCPRCHGTKYELIPGTSCLGNKACTACNGDGRRHLPRRHRKLVAEVIARIERIEGTLDSIVAKRV